MGLESYKLSRKYSHSNPRKEMLREKQLQVKALYHSRTTSGLHFFIRICIENRCVGKIKISALRKIREMKRICSCIIKK